MGLSHCFGSESIIYYNILSVYQINFRCPANAFIYYVCGREKIFWRVFSGPRAGVIHVCLPRVKIPEKSAVWGWT